jgi:hypothetical protein
MYVASKHLKKELKEDLKEDEDSDTAKSRPTGALDGRVMLHF